MTEERVSELKDKQKFLNLKNTEKKDLKCEQSLSDIQDNIERSKIMQSLINRAEDGMGKKKYLKKIMGKIP